MDALRQIAGREVDLRAGQHLEWYAIGRETLVELGDEWSHARSDVLVDAVDQVWRGDRRPYAVVDDRSTERDRGVPGPRPVVDARQDMGMDVDHGCGFLRWRR